jgi:glyoxylate carboligase
MDSIPMVAITGQVPSNAIGTDAFQEADIRGITFPITKHNYLVTKADDIPRAIAEAFHLASSGRPGPVLVDISKDALNAKTSFNWPPVMNLPGYHPTTKPNSKRVKEAAERIIAAKKPVLYVGGGVIRSNAAKELLQLAENQTQNTKRLIETLVQSSEDGLNTIFDVLDNRITVQSKELNQSVGETGSGKQAPIELFKRDAVERASARLTEADGKLKTAVDGSKIRKSTTKFAETVNAEEVISYVEKTLVDQESKIRKESIQELQDLLGVDASEFSAEEISALLESDKDISKDDEKIVRASIKKAFDILKRNLISYNLDKLNHNNIITL